ncbi:MAG: tRNA dihydrouridine(20/20a) synthase DusA [Gammaproteobacteria bacterium]|nr:MAG: tRNA dihydrouridine(20/20a) synthase DusA [Gammaproteobacteria bacterium]
MSRSLNRSVSIAPMMDWTDRHCRYFHRLITKQSLLYTEMVTTGAVINGDREKLLSFNQEEHPIALQLGGSDPKTLAECAKIGEDYGYDEINLNVGCPSDRVQSGRIGACLMADPELVRDGIFAMKQSCKIPVTVKHRIGIDDQDSYAELVNFVRIVAESGCDSFIVHARKAILSGLSPKQNRDIPPLIYDRVYQLKKDFPKLEIIINGGIKTIEASLNHLNFVDGVMIGREAYHNPYMLASVDNEFFGSDKKLLSRVEIAEQMLPYIERHISQGGKLQHISRHILGLFHAQPNGKQWRRHLSESATKPNAGIEVIREALSLVK